METPVKLTPDSTQAKGSVTRGIEQAGTGAHHAIDKMSDAARPAVDRMTTGAHQAVDRLSDVANQAVESLGVKRGQLEDAQGRLKEGVGDYVRANPVASLGIAVAAGFLLSRLISSR